MRKRVKKYQNAIASSYDSAYVRRNSRTKRVCSVADIKGRAARQIFKAVLHEEVFFHPLSQPFVSESGCSRSQSSNASETATANFVGLRLIRAYVLAPRTGKALSSSELFLTSILVASSYSVYQTEQPLAEISAW